jgi:triosephosphate isomerase
MKALIVANWKMNPPDYKAAKKLLEVTKKSAEKAKGVSIVIAPPSIYLRELRGISKSKKIAFAAQNAYYEKEGAFTGELSMQMLIDARAGYVLVGHAERRAAGETNDDTRKKINAALSQKLTPIFCVGESKRGPGGEHFDFVRAQLCAGLVDCAGKLSRVIIAYEPVWAIGAAAAMSPRDMHEMSIFIRKTIQEQHGGSAAAVKVLYGGSIEASNAPEMLREGDVAGLLVGRASADPVKVVQLLGAIASNK